MTTEPGRVDTPLVVVVDSDWDEPTTVEVSDGVDTHDVWAMAQRRRQEMLKNLK